MTRTDLSPLQRPSGAFAMLAVDQREAMRNMIAEHQDAPSRTRTSRTSSSSAARILTPYASRFLIDKPVRAWTRPSRTT